MRVYCSPPPPLIQIFACEITNCTRKVQLFVAPCTFFSLRGSEYHFYGEKQGQLGYYSEEQTNIDKYRVTAHITLFIQNIISKSKQNITCILDKFIHGLNIEMLRLLHEV